MSTRSVTIGVSLCMVMVSLCTYVEPAAAQTAPFAEGEFARVVDPALATGINFSKAFKADFNNDGVVDKVVCSNADHSVKVFDGKKLSNVLYSWEGPATNTLVTDPTKPKVVSNRSYTSCVTVELVPGRPSIVISDSYVHPVLGFRIGAEQYVVQNLGTDTAGALKMAVRIIRTGDNSIYRAAVRSVKCTPYPTQLVAAGNASGVLCFFAGYDQGIPGGYGDKVALLKLEDQNGKLVAKDLTGSSGLPWKGGVNGTPLSTFRTYKNYFGSGKYDGLSMMGGAWLDYNKDGLLDLITVGQHASIWAFKLVITSTKPEGISFTKTDVLTASNVSMTEFLTVSAFNEQDKSVMLPCVYITGEVDNLSAVKSYDVPDHARCFENGVWMVHKIPEGKAYSSTMQGASIKKDVTGRILALAPSFTHDSTGAHQPATPASNLFEINSSETCQVKIDSQLLNADKTAVIRSVSQTVSVTQGSSPRIGGWVDCNSTTHNAYFTNTTLVSGTSNITQLGWWTEANFLAHQSTFTAIQWKAATAFLAKPGVIKSLDIWNGCAKVNGRITATVVSCTAQEPIALADESSPFGQVLGAEAVSSEVVVNVITQIQKVIAQISALLQ